MTAELNLFADCPLPGCGNLVDDGGLCAACTEMMDEGWIREVAAA